MTFDSEKTYLKAVGKGNKEISLIKLYNEKLEWEIRFNFGKKKYE